jgi:hypothetical protein
MLWREGRPMTEAQWLACDDPLLLLPFLRTPWADWQSKGSNRRRLQLFVCATCRRFWPLLGDAGFQHLLEFSERDADGKAHWDGEAHWAEWSKIVESAWALYRNLPETTQGSHVCRAAVWSTVARANQNFAEAAIREMLLLNSKWSTLKHLLGELVHVTKRSERLYHVQLLHDIFGNPFRAVTFSPEWRTDTALSLARQMYESRDFGAMPILADALQDAGCDNEDILNHCRGEGPHVLGCWVVDLVLGKE